MKQFLSVLSFLLILSPASAQWEVKYNFGFLLDRAGEVTVERIFAGHIGLEAFGSYEINREIRDYDFNLDYFRWGWSTGISGKFYPSPQKNGSGVAFATYLRFRKRTYTSPSLDFDAGYTRFIAGVSATYKEIFFDHLLVEAGLGGGRALYLEYSDNPFGDYLDRQSYLGNIDVRLQLLLGWRF